MNFPFSSFIDEKVATEQLNIHSELVDRLFVEMKPWFLVMLSATNVTPKDSIVRTFAQEKLAKIIDANLDNITYGDIMMLADRYDELVMSVARVLEEIEAKKKQSSLKYDKTDIHAV